MFRTVRHVALNFFLVATQTADTAGMIPRAIHMIFTETEALKERGWRYQMYGQFVEIYNEKVSLASTPPGSRSFLTQPTLARSTTCSGPPTIKPNTKSNTMREREPRR